MAITISCANDISNIFTRSQHFLDPIFDKLEGLESSWNKRIPSGGSFPLATGYAMRNTTLMQQRLNPDVLNGWVDMVGLQGDCAVSCDPPTQFLEFGNAQQTWTRLQTQAFNTKPYCLESMLADALNVSEQIAQVYRDIKYVTNDVQDEFSRNNFVGISQNRWMGYDNGTTQEPLTQNWRFATNVNGNPNTTYIILNNTVNPNFISTLSTDLLNFVREAGIYLGTYPADGVVPLITDYRTFSSLPLYDTLRRQDMRHRAPDNSDPSFVATSNYAGFQLDPDQFNLRYNWTTTDPLYPGGVLKRVFHWTNETLSEGCGSNVNPAYLNADFQISIPRSQMPVFELLNGASPTSFGSGVTFAANKSPWNGNWVWENNKSDQFTPCNVDQNKGYWRSVFKMAARPKTSGKHGNAILHRRFPLQGINRVCATLKTTPSAGSYNCSNTCPPLDWEPPALVTIFECGQWNMQSCAR